MDAKARSFSSLLSILMTVGLCAVGEAQYKGVLPVGEVEYEFVYDWLERKETADYSRLDFQIGPYSSDFYSSEWGQFRLFRNQSPQKLTLFGRAAERYSVVRDYRGEARESLQGGLTASPWRQFFVYGHFVLDEDLAHDADYTGKKWRGLAGGVKQAFVNYRSQSFNITAGRSASFWGPRRSLMLSGDDAYDGFEYSILWRNLTLSYRLARLDSVNPNANDSSVENRYFAGHRLDWHLHPRVRIGWFEAVVFGGMGRNVEFYYLNPLIFFHVDQLNDDVNDNTLLGFDFTYKPHDHVKFYGQLLVDDFQIEKKTQGDQEPDQYGVLLGAYLVDIIEGVDLRLEYERVTNWTFNQKLERNWYNYNGEPIGSALGNDYDRVTLDLHKWYGQNRRIGIRYSHARQGEGAVTADWTEPWLDISGDYDEPFPTGIVETTDNFELNGTAVINEILFASFTGGYNFSSNWRHNDSQSHDFWHLKVIISALFSGEL